MSDKLVTETTENTESRMETPSTIQTSQNLCNNETKVPFEQEKTLLNYTTTGTKKPETENDMVTKNPFHFFVKNDLWLLIPALVCNALCAVTDVASTIMINKLFTSLTKFQVGYYDTSEDFLSSIRWPCFGLLLIGLGTTVFGWSETTLFTYLGERQQIRCRKKLFDSLLSRNLGWFENNSNLNGDLIQLNRSIEEFRGAISEYLSILFKCIFSIISLIIISMIYSWKLTLLMMAIVPLILIVIISFGNKIDKWAKREDDITADGISLLDWNFSCFSWIKIVFSKNLELNHYSNILNQCEISFRCFSIYANLVSSFMKTLSLLLFVQSFWFGSYLVKHHQNKGSDIISSFYSCLKLAMIIGSLSVIGVVFQKANTSFKKIVKFLLSDEDIENFRKLSLIPTKDLDGNISLDNVSFSYDYRSEDAGVGRDGSKSLNELQVDGNKVVLKNISFNIEPFRTTFIVGKSGSGKSTIASLLLKLHSPNSGGITIDGYDLNDLNTNWLRSQITLVQQFPKIFNDTIENNILLGTIFDDIYADDVLEAVDFFNFSQVIDNLPNGAKTYIGKSTNKGDTLVQLSGGQEQKLNLVKAKLLDTKILILDESVSALDIKQRELFMNKIYQWRENKTTIIITHELSNIRDDDMVIFVEEGMIVESGNKSVLTSFNGRFAELAHEGTPKNDIVNKEKYIKRETLFYDLGMKDIESQTITCQKYFNDETDFIDDETASFESDSLANVRAPIFLAYRLMVSVLSTKYKLIYLFGVLLVVCDSILTPIFSYCFSHLINGIIPQNSGTLIDTHEQVKWSVIATVIAIATGITSLISLTILEFVSERLCKTLQNMALAKILEQKAEFFERLNSNELSTLLMNDIRDFRKIFSSNLSRLISGFTVSIACIIWSLCIGWKYALVGFSMFPLFAIFSFISTVIMQKAEFSYKDSLNEAESVIYEVRVGIKTIMCLNVQDYFTRRFDSTLNSVLQKAWKRSISMGFSINIVHILVNIAQSIMIYYGFKLVANGEYQLVQMMQIVMMILMSVTFLSEIMSTSPGLYRGLRVVLKLNKLVFGLEEKSNNDNSIGYLTPNLKTFSTEDCISFSNVTFSYPSDAEHAILKNLTMVIPKNKIVSIVGEAGSGKSTIFLLILRLYAIEKSTTRELTPLQEIKINGYDIYNVNLSHLLSNIAVVTQKHYFMDGTIRENLLYGNPDRNSLNDEYIFGILQQLNLTSLVNNMGYGLDSPLSISGNLTVSGGQAQRFSIARALLRPASILLLDEFTSSLDTANIGCVMNILKEVKIKRNVTVICISHQEVVMRHSDTIFVLNDGTVCEYGDFDTLFSNTGGQFQQLLGKMRDI